MSKTIEIHQVLLVSRYSELVIWANTTKKFKVGNWVTLKNSSDPSRLWFIKEIYATQPLSNIHTDWKVGGL